MRPCSGARFYVACAKGPAELGRRLPTCPGPRRERRGFSSGPLSTSSAAVHACSGDVAIAQRAVIHRRAALSKFCRARSLFSSPSLYKAGIYPNVRWEISPMIACCGRLAGAILGISFAFQAACSIEATAQETRAGSMNSGACSGNGAAFDGPLSIPHWNGWGVDPSQHRFQPSDMARLTQSDLSRLKLKWAFGFPDATRSVAQPTIVGGRVFIGSQRGRVYYSLDAKSGCTYWEFTARSRCSRSGHRSSVNAATAGLRISGGRGRDHVFS